LKTTAAAITAPYADTELSKEERNDQMANIFYESDDNENNTKNKRFKMKKISTDRKIVFLMLYTFMAPFSYAMLRGYFPDKAKVLCFFIAIAVCFAFHLFGSFINYYISEKSGKSKPEHDKEKEVTDYIDKKGVVINTLIALAVAVIGFFIAFAMKKWYLAVTEHRTQADVAGYVYEILYSIFSFLIVLFDEITWYFPEEIFLPNVPNILYFFIPALVLLIVPPVVFSSKVYVSIIFLVIYLILLYIRGINRKKEERKKKQISEENK